MVLAVPLDIEVNFTDLKFSRLKSRESEKMSKFLIDHFVPLKGCKAASHVPIK